MNKKIKVIELLNKIANGEELPKKILILDEVYYLINDKDGDIVYSQLKNSRNWEAFIDRKLNITRCLHEDVIILDEVEIIEEQEEIDIQSIEEIEPAMNGNACVIDNKTWTLNQVIKAVKQLDKNIREDIKE